MATKKTPLQRAIWKDPANPENVEKFFKDLKTKSPEDQQKAMKRVFGKNNYDRLVRKGFFGKNLTKTALKLALVGLTGPVGMLATGISEVAAANTAGDPDELKKLRRAEKAIERRKKAGDRPGAPGGKKGGGKVKKNYSRGGGVRPTNY